MTEKESNWLAKCLICKHGSGVSQVNEETYEVKCLVVPLDYFYVWCEGECYLFESVWKAPEGECDVVQD